MGFQLVGTLISIVCICNFSV